VHGQQRARADPELVERRLDDGLVEEALAAIGGHADAGAQRLGRDAEDTAAAAKQHLHRLVGEDLLRRTGGLEAVLAGGDEGVALERLEADLDGDARPERGVLLHVEAAGQVGQPDEPEREQVAAVEGEVEEAGQVDEEGVGQVLRLVQDY
jgi:hypothetical protein